MVTGEKQAGAQGPILASLLCFQTMWSLVWVPSSNRTVYVNLFLPVPGGVWTPHHTCTGTHHLSIIPPLYSPPPPPPPPSSFHGFGLEAGPWPQLCTPNSDTYLALLPACASTVLHALSAKVCMAPEPPVRAPPRVTREKLGAQIGGAGRGEAGGVQGSGPGEVSSSRGGGGSHADKTQCNKGVFRSPYHLSVRAPPRFPSAPARQRRGSGLRAAQSRWRQEPWLRPGTCCSRLLGFLICKRDDGPSSYGNGAD